MISRWRCILVGCLLAVAVLFPMVPASAQSKSPAFNGAAIEAATTISNGVCSNSAIGISYQLPKGLEPQDAEAIRRENYGVDERIYGTGPVARWFIWGYGEEKQSAWLCGAEGNGNRIALTAMPARLVESQGPKALGMLVQGVGQQFGVQSSSVRNVAVNGLKLDCADIHAKANLQTRGSAELWATTCAGFVGSYVTMWIVSGVSKSAWKTMVASLDSVKLTKPQPLMLAPTGAQTHRSTGGQIQPDFKVRLDGFMKAWLAGRSTSKSMAFFATEAFSAPPFIGSYCTGWYHFGASPQIAEQFISSNLMGVPKDFPMGTPASAIFTAWNRLPPQWLSEAANDVVKDHFLIASLDAASLSQIFSGVFASSQYGKYLRGKIQQRASAYWVVFPEIMPDKDIFVIFTVWQKTGSKWKITDIDTVCQ